MSPTLPIRWATRARALELAIASDSGQGITADLLPALFERADRFLSYITEHQLDTEDGDDRERHAFEPRNAQPARCLHCDRLEDEHLTAAELASYREFLTGRPQGTPYAPVIAPPGSDAELELEDAATCSLHLGAVLPCPICAAEETVNAGVITQLDRQPVTLIGIDDGIRGPAWNPEPKTITAPAGDIDIATVDELVEELTELEPDEPELEPAPWRDEEPF